MEAFQQRSYFVNPHDIRSRLVDLVNRGAEAFDRRKSQLLLDRLKVPESLRTRLDSIENVFRICATKLAAIVAFSPAITIVSLVWISDGLVRREIRQMSAGRESAVIYHLAKRLLGPTIAWSTLTYLAVPVVISPWLFYFPVAVMVATLSCITVSRYKKYV